MIAIHHQKGASLLRKDQARRLRYQEAQRINSKSIPNFKDVLKSVQLTEGQLKIFTSKLIK